MTDGKGERLAGIAAVSLLLAAVTGAASCYDFGDLDTGEAGDASTDTGPVDAMTTPSTDVGPPDAVPGDAAEDAAPLPEAIVRIASLSFIPKELTIPAGTTVRWVMEDTGTFHFVVQGAPRAADDPAFESIRLDPGDDYTYTFDEPGTYTYHCSNHSVAMRDAKIIVE